MTGRNRLLIGVIALLALVGLAYLSLPAVIATLVERELMRRGFEAAHLRLGLPGWQRTRVHELSLRANAGAWRVDLQIVGAEIDYHPGLLLERRIGRLHVPQARLRLAPGAEDTAGAPAWIVPAPGEWIRSLPFDELRFERWRLEGLEAIASPINIRLDVGVQRQDGRLEATASLSADGRPPLDVSAVLTATGELQLALAGTGAKPFASLRAALRAAPPDRWSLNSAFELRLQSLAASLRPWTAADLWPAGASGTIHGEVHGTLPGTLRAGLQSLSAEARLEPRVEAQLAWPRIAGLGRDLEVRFAATGTLAARGLRFRLATPLELRMRPDWAALGVVPARSTPRSSTPVTATLTGARGELSWRGPSPQLDIDAGAQLNIEGIDVGHLRIPSVNVALRRPLRIGRSPAGRWLPRESVAFHLRAPEVGAAVPVHDLKLDASASIRERRAPVLRIDQLSAALLGGTVRGTALEVDFARAWNRVDLAVDGIDVGQLVRLERQEELHATGRLDGELPIDVGLEGIRVSNGRLHARPPGGTIRYRADASTRALAEANPNIGLALQALSDFQYQALDAVVNYSRDGDLHLALALAGRNPEWNAGQPINLNVNLEENIPLLLRSLQAADEIGGAVEQRVRERGAPRR